jgi:hypothetical protein
MVVNVELLEASRCCQICEHPEEDKELLIWHPPLLAKSSLGDIPKTGKCQIHGQSGIYLLKNLFSKIFGRLKLVNRSEFTDTWQAADSRSLASCE